LYLRLNIAGGKEATMRAGVSFRHATDLPALMDMEQARELLGMSRSAVYRAALAGHLPTLRFGRRVYVPTARLLAMLGLPPEKEEER
jgi:excisionase family DNA binding protein